MSALTLGGGGIGNVWGAVDRSEAIADEGDDDEALVARISAGLRASLERLRVDHVDLYLLHSQVRPRQGPTARGSLGIDRFREVVRPELERLRDSGAIRAWGLTAIGHPDALVELFEDSSKPDAVQCVANALDLSGDMWIWGQDASPGNTRVRAHATALDG